MDELKKQLSLLLEKGLIRLNVSPWGAPVLFAQRMMEAWGCVWNVEHFEFEA
jgi:hypothetical protein